MCDMADLKLAELQLHDAQRANDFDAALKAWDHLQDLQFQFTHEHLTKLPA